MKKFRLSLAAGLLALLLQSCQSPITAANDLPQDAPVTAPQGIETLPDEAGETPAAAQNPPAAGEELPITFVQPTPAGPDLPAEASPTPSPEASPEAGPLGPEEFPAGINPLTGLAVEDAENLAVPPALVSIANWPPGVRPQAGLSFSPLVFELYIGEGMTRFLSLFYGDFPEEAVQENEGMVTSDSAEIGPIRSGRLPYESLRKIYNGFLVMASAYSGVAQNLEEFTNIYGDDAGDVNSAMISVNKLADIARANKARLGNAELTGMAFDHGVPAGGSPAQRLWYMVSYLDQILWKYDEESGAYHRFQDNADGKTFIEASDRLTGEPLTFENLVVLFVNHRYCKEQAFDLDLMYIDRQSALAFRDGKMYPIYWSTKNTEYELTTGKLRPIRFLDADGNPFPLKPGQTWVHIVPTNTRYWETEDTMDLYQLLNNQKPGSGNWAMRFYPENMEYDVAVCEQIRPQ